MVKCFRRCEVIRRAAFAAASGRVRADGRSSRPRNTLPAPDRRPRVSFVGRFGAEFAPRRHRLGRLFVRRQARVETSHDDGNHLPPPGGHGTHRGNLRQLRHGIQAAGTRAYTTRTLSSAPRPPRALATPTRARPRSPSPTAFCAFTGAPFAIERQLTSPPRAGPLRVHVQAPQLRGRDQVHQGLHRAVQRGASNAAAPPPAGAGSLPRVIAPPIRALVAPSYGRQSVFSGNDETKGFFFFLNVARDSLARRLRPPSERRSSVRRAPRTTTSTDTFGPPRTRHRVSLSLSVASSRRRRDARRCPSSSRRPLWKS